MPSTHPPVHFCGLESIPPHAAMLHLGWKAAPRRLWYTYIGARRARSAEVDTWDRGTAGCPVVIIKAISSTKVLPIPVIITCGQEKGSERRRHGRGGKGQPRFESRRETYKNSKKK